MSTTPRPLSAIRASEVMHAPIVLCDPTTDLHHVASRMAAHQIHAVVVDGNDHRHAGARDGLAIVSADDLVRVAVQRGPGLTAAAIPSDPVVYVDVDTPLSTVASILSREGRSHALVTDAGGPVGVLSSLDVVAALAGLSAF
ncbi:CBS domain-containing protein [Patulibacter sp. NPDC049589]|uniref:CBS domain-containing protein n=1 Tax=Patulibacter sp. NPDC049589 TaxID=3154731 RepID=UPI003438D918